MTAGKPADTRTDKRLVRLAPRRKAHSEGIRRLIDRLLVILAVLALWQVVSIWVGADVLPRLPDMLAALWKAFFTQAYWSAMGSTLASTAIAVVIVVLIGVPLGALLGTSGILLASANLTIEFMRTIPPVTIIPLSLLLFGATLEMKLLVVVLGALWPVLYHTIYAIRDISQAHRDLVHVFRVPGPVAWARVFVPAMLPSIALGLRISVTIALLVSVACEVVGGAPGLGKAMLEAQLYYNLPLTYAYIVSAAFLGVVLNAITNLLLAEAIGRRSRTSTR